MTLSCRGQSGLRCEDAAAVAKESGPSWSDKMTAAAAVGMVQTKRFLTRMLPDSSRGEAAARGAGRRTERSAELRPHWQEQAFVAPRTIGLPADGA